MARTLFGTDGVRGLANEYPLDHDGAKRIGMAVGHYFAEEGQKVVIGQDTRESSIQIVEDLTAGLNAMGVDVVSVGVLPTPGLAYITGSNDDFVAGVMVTASHNPYQYNGIKVFDIDGGKLTDEIEAELNELIEQGLTETGQGQYTENVGLVSSYEDFLVDTADKLDLNGIKMAIDSANGSASGLAERVFTRLGAEVTPLFDSPDGRNINDGCGATDTKALGQVVLDKKLSLGIALDGDADRLIMIDELGREVKGDYLLYILAVVRQTDGVVATVMSNQGFEKALEKKGINLLRTDVGDRYVLEGLKKTGYKLGGEASGHIIFPLVLTTGDGMLAAVQTLRAISTSSKSLATWCDEVELLPQALVNIPVSNKVLLQTDVVTEFIKQQTETLGEGRILIRPSGTEPLARVMVEAPDAENKAHEIASKLEDLLSQLEQPKQKVEFPTELSENTAPLDATLFKEADRMLIKLLSDKGYEIRSGLNIKYAEDISQMCQQKSIKEYCPNDAGRRFTDLEATQKWIAKGRIVYLLISKDDGSLAGYGWGGGEESEHVPNAKSTFALRVGELAQGQGLATGFARLIVAATAITFDAQDFWLETWESDGAAVHIYHKLGFNEVDKVEDDRPTATGSLTKDTRLYMSLPNESL